MLLFASVAAASASESSGTVTLGGLPVPGVTVTAVQGAQKLSVVTGPGGTYTFPDLKDGTWTITVDMLCFEPQTRDITVSAVAGADAKWELKMLPLAAILATAEKLKIAEAAAPPLVAREATPAAPRPEAAPDPQAVAAARAAAADGLLINGTTSNAATSQFSMAPAFGNTRSSKNLYTGGLALVFDTSVLDAAPYSFTGANTGKPAYNQVTATFTFGGPLNIPHLMPHGPNLFLAYQFTRNSSDVTLPGLVPTTAERQGILAGDPGAPSVVVPTAQAAALLALLSAAERRRQHAVQLRGAGRRQHSPGRLPTAHGQDRHAAQPGVRQHRSAQHTRQQRQPVRLCRLDRHLRARYRRHYRASLRPAPVPDGGLPLHTPAHADHA